MIYQAVGVSFIEDIISITFVSLMFGYFTNQTKKENERKNLTKLI